MRTYEIRFEKAAQKLSGHNLYRLRVGDYRNMRAEIQKNPCSFTYSSF